ncbi:hypothetical protein [Paraburkholderia aspalathi]|uniref:Uncharacterized protein n=1 Tax=Paraburkholderia aspalathi TaxID=1324617 RepID=A0A1I7DCG0_9BURK|nr:hypothetical protein [Paraburkholderia aspalathi]SFU09422.1 hypothetical protein SAMN05192563_1009156 [Paraburkholderia aspalathi]
MRPIVDHKHGFSAKRGARLERFRTQRSSHTAVQRPRMFPSTCGQSHKHWLVIKPVTSINVPKIKGYFTNLYKRIHTLLRDMVLHATISWDLLISTSTPYGFAEAAGWSTSFRQSANHSSRHSTPGYQSGR